MRKLGLLLVAISILYSCEPNHPKDYLTFAGTIDNLQGTEIYIIGEGVRKTIQLNNDGSFKDTLKVDTEGLYTLSSKNHGRAVVYLDNGYNLNVSGNANDFFKSLEYSGDDEAADSNNLIVSRYNFGQSAGNVQGFIELEKEDFLNKVNKYKKGMDSISSLYGNVNKEMLEKSNEQNNAFFKNMVDNYDRMHQAMLMQKKAEEKLGKGKPAPEFFDYENIKGGTKSLKDFRGKYVYIDVWATWCKPCIAQIPYLKKLEEEYKNKNIVFLSISTDDQRRSGGSWEKAHDKWAKMVKEKNLSGVQLWAGKDDARFSQEYLIRGIPRFILIDPKGNIVNSNARRPTDPNIRSVFNALPGI